MYLNFRPLPMLKSNVKGSTCEISDAAPFRRVNLGRFKKGVRKRAASLISLEEREGCEADGRARLQVRPLPVVE
jgi:hypothetical protein